MARDFQVGGTSLDTVGRVVQTWEGVVGSPPLVGDPVQVPGAHGEYGVTPQFHTGRDIVVGLVITGSTVTDFHDKLRTLEALVWSPASTLTLTRQLPLTAGTETVTCSAQFVDGLSPRMESDKVGRFALTFRNLDGVWYSESDTSATVDQASGDSITMPGTAWSNRMTLTFSGVNATQLLTNTTTGYAVTVTGDKTVNDVVLDVDDWTAVQNGSNVIGTVTHSGGYHWMMLQPGVNNFTLSGAGSVTIDARAAYL